MEVKIISMEAIKPSTEKHHLPHPKSLQLSLLDQLSPPCYTPLILFYQNFGSDVNHFSPEVAGAALHLKTSLSDAFSHFPLLAGTIKGDSIVCNGYGGIFKEAKINFRLSEFLKNPQLQVIDELVPFGIRCTGKLELSVQVGAQINVFTCGGIAIGVSFLHKIIDGTTFSYFLKSWASISKGSFQNPTIFDYGLLSELFPPRELNFSWVSGESPFISKGKRLERRFLFKSEKISNLKSIAMSKTVPYPTTVEVITGFIWKHALKAAWEVSGSIQPSVLNHAVDLRRRKNPPLPENSTGNIFWQSVAYYEAPSGEPPLDEMVGLVRKSFEEINSDYVKKMMGFEGFDRISNSIKEVGELHGKKVCSYGFTSWVKMGLNEVDFGWGKPVWVCKGGAATGLLRNIVVLVESGWSEEDGIEAWIALDEDEMKILESDFDFLEFASLNPSIPHTCA